MHANQCCALYSKGRSGVNMHKKTTKDQMMPAKREGEGGGGGGLARASASYCT